MERPRAAGLALPPDEAHLYTVSLADAQDADLLAAYRALLSPDERARHDRLIFAASRHEFLVTRALVRTVLSRYAPTAPADWSFTTGPFGKPAAQAPAPRFNLSNTGGMVVCLVAADRDVGVDVEDTLRSPPPDLDLAERFFAPTEAAALRALPGPAQLARFFTCWTLKESYIKARGLGLSLPLSSFWFTLAEDASIALSVEPEQDDGHAWHFELLRPTPRHLIACCVQRSTAPPRLVTYPIVPLRASL